MEIAIPISIFIILIFLSLLFRKPINKINDLAEKIGDIVKNKLDIMAIHTAAEAEKYKREKEKEIELKELGIDKTIDEIIEYYSNKSKKL